MTVVIQKSGIKFIGVDLPYSQKPIKFNFCTIQADSRDSLINFQKVGNGQLMLQHCWGGKAILNIDDGLSTLLKYRPWWQDNQNPKNQFNINNFVFAYNADFTFLKDGAEYTIPDLWVLLGNSIDKGIGGVDLTNALPLGIISNTGNYSVATLAFSGYDPVSVDCYAYINGNKNNVTTVSLTPNKFQGQNFDPFEINIGLKSSKNLTNGPTAFCNELNQKISSLFNYADNNSTLDIRPMFKDNYFRNYKNRNIVATIDAKSFDDTFYITDAIVQKDIRILSQDQEFVSSADLRNDSGQTVTIKTADYTHKITQTHSFVREATSETSQQIAIKTTINVPFEVLNEKVEVTGTFAWKQTEKMADTFTTTDERTYNLSGQQVNLSPNSSIHIDTAFTRGTVAGTVTAYMEINKVTAYVDVFPDSPKSYCTFRPIKVELDLDFLYEKLKLKTLTKKTYTGEDGSITYKYFLDMNYYFSGDVGANMIYLIDNGKTR